MLDRLYVTIAAVCPLEGAAITGPTSARLDIAPTATQAQRTAAQAALAAFDWSSAAHAAWEIAQKRNTAKAWILGPTMEAKAFRALAMLVLEQVNALRTRATMTPASYTAQQLLDAIVAKVDAE